VGTTNTVVTEPKSSTLLTSKPVIRYDPESVPYTSQLIIYLPFILMLSSYLFLDLMIFCFPKYSPPKFVSMPYLHLPPNYFSTIHVVFSSRLLPFLTSGCFQTGFRIKFFIYLLCSTCELYSHRSRLDFSILTTLRALYKARSSL
jgi:hypothetical protein